MKDLWFSDTTEEQHVSGSETPAQASNSPKQHSEFCDCAECNTEWIHGHILRWYE